MKKINKILLSSLIGLSFPQSVNAVVPSGCTEHLLDTGLGNIPTDPTCLARWVLANGIILGGGIAFLLSVFGGVSIILAGGDPEKINQGKQMISSAITGLLFIIFSIFLLELFGVKIFRLPDFSS